MASGDAFVVCGVEAGTCALAGNRLMPAKPADNRAMEKGTRTADRGPRLVVSGYERRFRVVCIYPDRRLKAYGSAAYAR
jgi:hypothetical protein